MTQSVIFSTVKRRIGTALLNLAVPRKGYRILRDLAYGAHARQKLDLYIPDGLKQPAPVLLFFYGGSWQSGDKSWYRVFGEAFTSKGIVVAVADYRIFPEVRYPSFVEDCAEALRYIHHEIASHGGDPARLFLAGHSAGAYNAAMIVCDPGQLKRIGGDPSWVRGVIGIAGPYDFLPLKDPVLIDIFGGDCRRETLPITFIAENLPPMLLAAGSNDRTVSWKNTKRMAAKLRDAGNDVAEIIYPGIGHIEILLSLARPLRRRSALREDISRFIREK